MTDLRCVRHLHGRLDGAYLVVKCHQCGRATGRPVLHRFRLAVEEDGALALVPEGACDETGKETTPMAKPADDD